MKSEILWSRDKSGVHWLTFTSPTGSINLSLQYALNRDDYLKLCAIVRDMERPKASATSSRSIDERKLKALAEYFGPDSTVKHSIYLELPNRREDGQAFFNARESLGLHGWLGAEETESILRRLLEQEAAGMAEAEEEQGGGL